MDSLDCLQALDEVSYSEELSVHIPVLVTDTAQLRSACPQLHVLHTVSPLL